MYYIATDEKRQDIPWVSAEYNGKTTEYLSTDSTLTPEQIASAEKRKMDCVDCHNRATHVFQNPDDALNEALKNGTIAADLPYIKQYGSEVLSKKYATEAEAAAAIAGVTEIYKTQHPDVYAARQADVETAVDGPAGDLRQDDIPVHECQLQSRTPTTSATRISRAVSAVTTASTSAATTRPSGWSATSATASRPWPCRGNPCRRSSCRASPSRTPITAPRGWRSTATSSMPRAKPAIRWIIPAAATTAASARTARATPQSGSTPG